MRACQPSRDGYVARDRVKVHYEVFGAGEPTVMLLPTWSIIHSRHWKLQVPDLARRHRVITFDGRGNGLSDRPAGPEAYRTAEFTADALAVMDATGTERAVLAGLSLGATWALELGALHPERVAGIIFIGPAVPLVETSPRRSTFTERLDTTDGWAKFNQHYWREHYREFIEFFMHQIFIEPHSTKPIEDAVAWGLETDPETLIATQLGVRVPGEVFWDAGRAGELVTIEGGGHAPHVRDPVKVNLLLREFIASLGLSAPPPTRTWTRALRRPRRVLYISSPIGLGHARRDLAIARELRRLRPDLEVEWLAQDPVTRVLEAAGERLHPASGLLANESAHIESESAEHDLHCFQAIRRMDEILLANFMVFHDVVADRRHDLVVGDEAWEVDHFLHENPELKQTAYAWLTDFVGWLPMPDGGPREASITADYNAGLADRQALRAELGYGPDERVCVVTVGGSGVGAPLLRKVMAAYPLAKRAVPELRMMVVAGRRIDPASLPAHDGLEVRAFVPGLYRHLAACDLAVVQGGLTTCMELVANRRPFLYFPLRHHFEQNFHVAHRLDRHRAGRRMDYASSDPDLIADAIATEIGREVAYRPVGTDGAARAAA